MVIPLRGAVENLRKPRCLEFVGENTREERAACKGQSHPEESSRDLPRDCLKSLAVHYPVHACEETARGWEKNCQK